MKRVNMKQDNNTELPAIPANVFDQMMQAANQYVNFADDEQRDTWLTAVGDVLMAAEANDKERFWMLAQSYEPFIKYKDNGELPF